MGLRADGKWAASRCGLAVPRQNGKNAILEMRELFGMVMLGEKFLHTAHEVKTARKAFLRLRSFFDNKHRYPELAALVKDIRQTNGQEAIVLTTGGSCEFVARSKGSGRGFTVDILVMDEAQELNEDALEALLPTISASPLQNPQQILTGTPPGPSANGEIFTRLRNDGVAGNDRRLSWFEWSCEHGVDPRSPASLAQANPALGIRLQREVADAERESLTEAGYARERLGMWASDQAQAVIDPGVWAGRATSDDLPPPPLDEPPAVLALDRWHDGATSLAAAWRMDDDRLHVELIAVDVTDDSAAVVEEIAARAGRKIPVFVASDSPAASLVSDLKAKRVKVTTTSTADLGKACVGFLDDAVAGRMTHADQDHLNTALAGAKTIRIGAGGSWGWDRKRPENDISPLVAATLARFGAVVTKKKAARNGEAVFR
jgi:hypothetical protein